jgi:hypothetical protein
MAINNYQQYLDLLKENRVADFQTSAVLGRAQRMSALWPSFLPAPSTPTTSTALDSTSDVAIGPIPSVGSGQLSILGGRLNTGGAAGVGLILIDLLNHSGGMAGNITGSQTTNIPTAPLTRYTDGNGVMAGLIIHTQVGTVACTVTATYTNQLGVTGNITTPTSIGATGFREIRSLILLPLAAGDTGVRSVESVNISGSTATATGTIGNFGVCLFKPLSMIPLNDVMGAMPVDAVSTGGFIASLTGMPSGSCITCAAIANTTQTLSGAIILGEI